jgi:hypothetical protein
MYVGKIKNEAFLGWTGLEALPGNTRPAFELSVRPNPVVDNAYFDIWTPQTMAGKKAVLEVYNAQGRLVFKADPSIPGACAHVTWNGRSRSGRPLASGKYVAYVKVGKEVLHSAFALIR